jgi:hypothetical protein
MALALAGALGPGSARAQDVGAEDGFVAHIAQERAARGLPGLAFAADLQEVARRQAQRMADRHEPFHNPNLGSEVQGWSIVAENVGMGPDVDTVHRLFMESASHRSSILSTDLTQVGVGVVRSADGYLWVAQVFRRPAAAAAPAPAPAPAPPAPSSAPAPAPPRVAAPAPVAPTTTTPPTTAPPAPPTTAAPAPPTTVAAAAPQADLVAARRAAEVGALAAGPDVVGLTDLPRAVPPAAAAATLLLAGVVGLQAATLRRLGLVR